MWQNCSPTKFPHITGLSKIDKHPAELPLSEAKLPALVNKLTLTAVMHTATLSANVHTG